MAAENEPLLELRNVSVKFGEVWGLRNISFTLFPGETRIILGAAGSGKTTLLKSVIGLIPIDEGEIRLFGEDVTTMTESQLFALRSRAGILFQEGGLFDSLTVGENVEYPLLNRQTDGSIQAEQVSSEDVERRVRDALTFVELGHTLEKFPAEISGGMRRRVGIARAIVTEPPLVLYDSPTAGLDPITANTIMALVAKERDAVNTASLIITHRHQDGELMAKFRYNTERRELEKLSAEEEVGEGGNRTKFIVMKEGEIVFFGSLRELENSSDKYVTRFIRQQEE